VLRLRLMVAPPETKRRATYRDLERVPDTMVAEIVDGELFASPRPAPRHAVAASVLGGDLNPPFHQGRGGPGGWWILSEPELHFGEDVLVPDLAGWTRERLPSMPQEAFFTLAPDWVWEVISPHNERHDRARKLPVYAREGVRHAWLVDPLERSLEVLRLEVGRWNVLSIHRGDEIVRAEPFQVIEVDLLPLWAESRESR
jgi:Uma2 family endonuclease